MDEFEDKRKAERAENRSKKDQEALKLNGRQKFKAKRIYCPICDKSFSSESRTHLKNHISQVHPEDFHQEQNKTLKSTDCGARFE